MHTLVRPLAWLDNPFVRIRASGALRCVHQRTVAAHLVVFSLCSGCSHEYQDLVAWSVRRVGALPLILRHDVKYSGGLAELIGQVFI